MSISRRQFLKSALAAAVTRISPGLLTMAASSSLAAASDYRAAVCICLDGGNDANNCLVRLDDAGYEEYSNARGLLALPRSALLPVRATGSGQPFGLHPSLRGLSELFDSGRLGVVANVGTLVSPLTREQYLQRSVAVPTELFSHSDQKRQWQSSQASRYSRVSTGWGGKIADHMAVVNGAAQFPSMTAIGSTSLYCEGDIVRPAAVHPTETADLHGFGASSASAIRYAALQRLAENRTGLALVDATAAANRRMLNELNVLNAIYATYPDVSTPFPNNSLGWQMRRVARLISARHAFGLNRQMFFVSITGFDTHSEQLNKHARLLSELDAAMTAFYRATEELNVASQVLTFTLSEFGRTVLPAKSGSDHGWGGHHFVMGGSVHGGDVYGAFPSLQIGGPDHADNKGRLIPTTSVDQYAATIASWMGVASADVSAMFPNLANFGTPRLGFV